MVCGSEAVKVGVLAPLTSVHKPLPTVGIFAARVKLV